MWWLIFHKNNLNLDYMNKEEDLQARCVAAYRAVFRPGHAEYWAFYKVHNEGAKSPRRAGLDGLMGLLAGQADMSLDWPSGQWHGAKVEFKAGGVQGPAQKVVAAAALVAGYRYIVVTSVGQFTDFIGDWFGQPFRGTELPGEAKVLVSRILAAKLKKKRAKPLANAHN